MLIAPIVLMGMDVFIPDRFGKVWCNYWLPFILQW